MARKKFIVHFEFGHGEAVRDVVTGFSGLITARCDHLTGCNRYYVTPGIDTEGKWVDGVWLDEARLVLNPRSDASEEARELAERSRTETDPGGDAPNPPAE